MPSPSVDGQDVPQRGTKRARIDEDDKGSDDNDQFNGHAESTHASHHVHQAHYPDGGMDDTLVYFEDECHEDYELIRVPKKRNFDLFRVAHQMPEERNTAELPLTVTKADGSKATMWAKMDTGADINIIHQSTLEALFGGLEQAKQQMREMTAEEIKLIGGRVWDVTHSVNIDFIAGVHNKHFDQVNFFVREGSNAETDDHDGVPNVILGFPFLRHNAMLMIDVEYCHEPEMGLEVLAHRAEEEQEDVRSALWVRGAKKAAGVEQPPSWKTKQRGIIRTSSSIPGVSPSGQRSGYRSNTHPTTGPTILGIDLPGNERSRNSGTYSNMLPG